MIFYPALGAHWTKYERAFRRPLPVPGFRLSPPNFLLYLFEQVDVNECVPLGFDPLGFPVTVPDFHPQLANVKGRDGGVAPVDPLARRIADACLVRDACRVDPDHARLRREITTANRVFSAAYLAGVTAAIREMYTPQALALMKGGRTVIGARPVARWRSLERPDRGGRRARAVAPFEGRAIHAAVTGPERVPDWTGSAPRPRRHLTTARSSWSVG